MLVRLAFLRAVRLTSGFVSCWELSHRVEEGFDVSAVQQLLMEPDPLLGLGRV